MRLWSIHPKYLDSIGLVALWRESLLAQKVLKCETKSHKNHPQLKKFKAHPRPQYAIANYLVEIWKESKRRKYNFNKEKIGHTKIVEKIPITRSELRYEFDLLRERLKKRAPSRYQDLLSVKKIECHPLFKIKNE